jgi:quinol-cytochrome oxidoreductase complex cytochrome b subunit
VPFPFRPVADPYHTPAGTRPPWYMLAPYTLFQVIPGPDWIVGLVLLVAALAVLLLPFWIREDESPGRRRAIRIGGVAALVLWTLLCVAGVFLDRP